MVKLFRFLVLTALLLAVSQMPSHAQYQFGVMWDVPENPQTAINQLQQFEAMGVSAVEIKEQPLPVIWEQIDELDLEVYGNLGIEFPITQTFAEPDSLFIDQIEKKASFFLSQPSVKGLGLFEFGPIHKNKFQKAVNPFSTQLKRAGVEVYFVSSRIPSTIDRIADTIVYNVHLTPANVNSFTLPENSVLVGYRFSVSSNLNGMFLPFNHFLQAADQQKIIFLHSDWLFSILEIYPRFKQTLFALATQPDAVYPIPEETLPERNQSTIPILILLVVWGATAIIYSSNPLYRKSLFRYFTGHKFFIKDIFDRHLRSPWPAFIIILQNTLLISGGIYSTFSVLFSPLGEKALFHHFPALSIWGNSPFSLLSWLFVMALVISSISIIWLFILHKGLKSITQIATIYAWPLQVNIIVITIAIAIFAAGGNGFWLVFFNTVALFIFLLAFVLTSVDAARFLNTKPKLYLLGTNGLYLIILGTLVFWVMTREDIQDILSLSLNLK